MTKYEILLLLDPETDDGRQTEILGRMREQVEKSRGSWDLHDAWGRRRLAYEIDHKTDGTYHLVQFTSDAETLDEISRVLRIDDAVMRHMATRRIEGSPARPVALSAPARQDERVPDATVPETQDVDVEDAEVDEEPVEVAVSAEVEEEE